MKCTKKEVLLAVVGGLAIVGVVLVLQFWLNQAIYSAIGR